MGARDYRCMKKGNGWTVPWSPVCRRRHQAWGGRCVDLLCWLPAAQATAQGGLSFVLMS